MPEALRRLIVDIDPKQMNVTKFCLHHGISTWFFYDLRRNYAKNGEAALVPASRAPHRVANRTSAEIEERIVVIRKELADTGLDNGPATIWSHLIDELEDQAPSEATIYRILKRRGFVVADPSKAPKHAGRTFTATRANECWQIDDTRWPLADGNEVKIINVLDDCTRVLVASVASFTCTSADAFDVFCSGATRWGWPARFLSDNARAFRHGLGESMRAIGVAAGHSRPYHPQTCGKVERLHRTLKQFLDKQGPALSLEQLQSDQLDVFTDIYNHRRPHRGIGRRRPAEMWENTPKAGPADRPLDAPTKVHQGRVSPDGRVAVGTHLVISLGVAHAGAKVVTVVTGLRATVFRDGQLIRALELVPGKRHQALHPNGWPPSLP